MPLTCEEYSLRRKFGLSTSEIAAIHDEFEANLRQPKPAHIVARDRILASRDSDYVDPKACPRFDNIR